jgi:hypothetical protein
VSFAWSLRLLLVQFFASSALTGLIWTIQVVHYPLFDQVEVKKFVRFEQSHSLRISLIVGPLMAVEFLCAGLLLWSRPADVPLWLVVAAFIVMMVVHAATVLYSVPAHTILGKGFDTAAHRRLVRTNWIRTVGWTLRAILAAYMVTLVAMANI